MIRNFCFASAPKGGGNKISRFENRSRRVSVSPGFFVLLALLYYLDGGLGLLGWGLTACALHELGHGAAIRLLGGGIERISLTAVGAELALDGGRPLSYGRECAAALAGPGVSLLTALLAARGKQFLLAGLSLGQGMFNLLPVLPLDGGRALCLLLSGRLGADRAEAALGAVSAVLSGLLLGGGLILMRVFGNPTLLVTAAWLTAGQIKKGGGR